MSITIGLNKMILTKKALFAALL